MKCKNGKANLADGQEVSNFKLRQTKIFTCFHFSCLGNSRVTQLPRELPQQGQVQLEDQGARQKGGAHLV